MRNSFHDQNKPSREVRTISSLVDKFTISKSLKDVGDDCNSHLSNFSKTFYKPCSHRGSLNNYNNNNKNNNNKNINNIIKHEKFTPCNHFNNINIEQNNEFYEIEFNKSNPNDFVDVICSKGNYYNNNVKHNNVILAPPRRKRKSAIRQLSESSADISLDSNINLELWNNSRNLELSKHFNNQPLNNYSCNKNNEHIINYINNHNKNINNYNNNNNKSGCSNLDLVRKNSLERNNEIYFRTIRNSDKDIINSDDKKSLGYCKNKIYYKNSSFDKYGNYNHSNDIEEVIVCESIINSDSYNHNNINNVPENSTYTKFYTDSLYCDRDDGVSSTSSDGPFDKMIQLTAETQQICTKIPFERLKLKKLTSSTTQNEKRCRRSRHASLNDQTITNNITNELIPTHNRRNFHMIKPFATLSRIEGSK